MRYHLALTTLACVGLLVACNEDPGSPGTLPDASDPGEPPQIGDTGSGGGGEPPSDTMEPRDVSDTSDRPDSSDTSADTSEPDDTSRHDTRSSDGGERDVTDGGRADAGPADTSDTSDGGSGAMTMSWDFANGAQEWKAGLTDYPSDWNLQKFGFEADIRSVPSGLNRSGTGHFLSSENNSDDLFMFLKRKIGRGLQPNTAYRLNWTITFASKAPSNCVGIGGAPGESVYLKAGGSTVEPKKVVDDGNYRLNVDKGNQSTGGPAASVTGHIANGVPCEKSEDKYKELVRNHTHTSNVMTNGQGELWLLLGTDSGFEGRTSLYYLEVDVTFEPTPN